MVDALIALTLLLTGRCACQGSVEGVVRIVTTTKGLKKFKKGDILVARCTDIDYVPYMSRAGAIITEMGGITSHAAIVSRELGVPCIVGATGAMTVLQDGQRVVVDATCGRVLG